MVAAADKDIALGMVKSAVICSKFYFKILNLSEFATKVFQVEDIMIRTWCHVSKIEQKYFDNVNTNLNLEINSTIWRIDVFISNLLFWTL